MNELFDLLRRHGYQLVFIGAFLESIGFPVPAAIILVVAGAMSLLLSLKIYAVIGVALAAMMLGDLAMYILGRSTGWTILGVICRISLNPETCIVKSADLFYRRGKMTLLFSKFLPGISTLATPLAGSLKMRPGIFLAYDFLGALLYVVLYAMLGFVFSKNLASIGHGLAAAQRIVTWVVVATLAAYIFYRIRNYRKNRMYRVVPYITIEELKKKMARQNEKILICDVRSHGYYEKNATRIPGSIRLEPASITSAIATLPRDKELYLYCT